MIYGLKYAALWECYEEECWLRERRCNEGEINNTREYEFPWPGEDREGERKRCIRKMKTRLLRKTNSIPYCSSLRRQHGWVEHVLTVVWSFYYTQSILRQITALFLLWDLEDANGCAEQGECFVMSPLVDFCLHRMIPDQAKINLRMSYPFGCLYIVLRPV